MVLTFKELLGALSINGPDKYLFDGNGSWG